MKSSRAQINARVYRLPAFRFEDQRLTSYAGLVLLHALLRHLGLQERPNSALGNTDFRRVLAVRAKSSATFGFDIAFTSLDEELRHGTLDSDSVQAVAARMALEGLQALPESGPDLGAYDQAFISPAGGKQ